MSRNSPDQETKASLLIDSLLKFKLALTLSGQTFRLSLFSLSIIQQRKVDLCLQSVDSPQKQRFLVLSIRFFLDRLGSQSCYQSLSNFQFVSRALPGFIKTTPLHLNLRWSSNGSLIICSEISSGGRSPGSAFVSRWPLLPHSVPTSTSSPVPTERIWGREIEDLFLSSSISRFIASFSAKHNSILWSSSRSEEGV